MAKNQISFFATQSDLLPVLQAVEGSRPFEYIPSGSFNAPTVKRLESLITSPNLGIATVGDSNHEATYLIASRGTEVQIRDVPQRRGGVKYAVDQVANPKTIAIRPGGMYQDKYLIAGQIGTASDDKDSFELFKLFSGELTKRFEKVKSFYVGPEARTLLDKGWRLTASVKASPEYDLKRN